MTSPDGAGEREGAARAAVVRDARAPEPHADASGARTAGARSAGVAGERRPLERARALGAGVAGASVLVTVLGTVLVSSAASRAIAGARRWVRALAGRVRRRG